MKIPERFSIERIEDYHTHHLGRFSNGIQFFGTIEISFKKYHLLVYYFDKEGNNIGTEHKCSEVPFDMEYFERMNSLQKEIEKMIDEMGIFQYCDIIVKPFEIKIEIENNLISFGLIPCHHDGYSTVDLMPSSSISFREPWDGSYDT